MVAALCVAAATAQERVSATEKGSILIFPKVEVRYNAAGDLIQDTFIQISNDFNEPRWILLYFVSETCTNVDNDITLTQNEPAYWSAATGLPKGVSPWGVLGQPYPDPEGSTDLVSRGYVIAIAINSAHQPVRWNHLTGVATIVNYANGDAWEYNAYAFQAIAGSNNGQVLNSTGELYLNGSMYDYGFNRLVLEYIASGSTAFSGGGQVVTHDTELALMILDQDLRQDYEGPFQTKARFEIWNENETSFSGSEYCFTKWDQSLLSSKGRHFLVGNLQTNRGRARIDGIASPVVCGQGSRAYSLLGVAAKILTFSSGDVATAGTNLVGVGTESATIKYDLWSQPEELKAKMNGFGGLQSAPVNTMPR